MEASDMEFEDEPQYANIISSARTDGIPPYIESTVDGIRQDVTVKPLQVIPAKLKKALMTPKDKRKKPYQIVKVPLAAAGFRPVPIGNLREMSDPYPLQIRDRFTDAALMDPTAQPALEKRNKAFYSSGYHFDIEIKSSRDKNGILYNDDTKLAALEELGKKYNPFLKILEDWSHLKPVKMLQRMRTSQFAANVQGRIAVKIFPPITELEKGMLPTLKNVASEHMGNVIMDRDTLEIVALRIQSVDTPQLILLPDEMIYIILRDSGLKQEERFYGRSIMEPFVQMSRTNKRAVDYDYAKAIVASYNPKIMAKMPVSGTPEEKDQQLLKRATDLAKEGTDVVVIEADEFSSVESIPNNVNHEMMSKIREDIDTMMIPGMGSTKLQMGRVDGLTRENATIMEISNIKDVRTPDELEIAEFFETELLMPLLAHLTSTPESQIPIRIKIIRNIPKDEISIVNSFDGMDSKSDSLSVKKEGEMEGGNFERRGAGELGASGSQKKKLDSITIYFNELISLGAAAKDVSPSLKDLKKRLDSIESEIDRLQGIADDKDTQKIKQLEKEMSQIQEEALREIDNTDSSSFVGKATYTPELSTVEFLLNGSLYNYCNVSSRKWESYAGSPSKGAAYNRLFKGQNPC